MDDSVELGPSEYPDHPIPRLDALDTVLTHDSGAYVGIVISSPLDNDSVSQARLARKIGVSLAYFQSPDFLQRFGPATAEGCRIYIDVHAGSHPLMLESIGRYGADIASAGITPVITRTHRN
jgi:hypothetical protein